MKQMDDIHALVAVAAADAIDASRLLMQWHGTKNTEATHLIHMLKTDRSTTKQMPEEEGKMLMMMKFLMWNNQSDSNQLK